MTRLSKEREADIKTNKVTINAVHAAMVVELFEEIDALREENANRRKESLS